MSSIASILQYFTFNDDVEFHVIFSAILMLTNFVPYMNSERKHFTVYHYILKPLIKSLDFCKIQ